MLRRHFEQLTIEFDLNIIRINWGASMKNKLITAIFVIVLSSGGMAQSRERSDRSGGHTGGAGFFGHFLGNQVGLFSLSSGSSGFGLGFPRQRSRSFFHQGRRSLFTHQLGGLGRDDYGVHGSSFLTWPWNYTDQPTDTDRFVESWIDQDPFENRASSGFSQSALLQEGMSEEEVVQAVGTPAERFRLGHRETWKYSSYSLVFEQGALKQIR